MRDRRRTWACHALDLLAVCALALPAAATQVDEESVEPEGPPEAVAVELRTGQLLFVPRVDVEAVTVTLSCADGTYVQREYEGVGPVSLSLSFVSDEHQPVADGRCKYEVLVHPFVDREAMRAAEAAGDFSTIRRLSRIEQEQMEIVTGSFEVVGGAIHADR